MFLFTYLVNIPRRVNLSAETVGQCVYSVLYVVNSNTHRQPASCRILDNNGINRPSYLLAFGHLALLSLYPALTLQKRQPLLGET